MKNVFDLIVCPVCGSRLEKNGGSLFCTGEGRRHTFDIASEGYVNLLPPGKKNNAKTGDRRELIRSRTRFLGTGKYDRISDAVASLILKYAPRDADGIAVADLGCGEGYHTCRIADAVRKSGAGPTAVGIDASKYGVAAGAKRAAGSGFSTFDSNDGSFLCFFAGNVFRPPMADLCLDGAVSMFAPVAWEEAARVLRHGGVLTVTGSGPDHLIEMRKMIYDDVRVREKEPPEPEGFRIIGTERLTYRIDLESREETADLFGMTPFACRVPESVREKMTERDGMTVTVDAVNTVYEKI